MILRPPRSTLDRSSAASDVYKRQEVCSKCHPFFTGQQKFVDIKGKIDKFKEKQARGAQYKTAQAAKLADKKTKKDKETN